MNKYNKGSVKTILIFIIALGLFLVFYKKDGKNIVEIGTEKIAEAKDKTIGEAQRAKETMETRDQEQQEKYADLME